MVTNRVSPRLLALFAAVSQAAAVSAQGMSAIGPGSMGQKNNLLDARAKEIKAIRPGDAEVSKMTDLLKERLKWNPEVQVVVSAPCPPPTGPAPADDKSITKPQDWEKKIGPSVSQETEWLNRHAGLASNEKSTLNGFVAPEFRKFGDDKKLQTVVGSPCQSAGAGALGVQPQQAGPK